MTTQPDDGADLVARHLPPAPRAGEPCPDDATLLAFAEGTLPASLRAEVERHVAACETCREAVGWALDAQEAPAEVVAPHAASSLRRHWIAVAAGLLLAVGLAWWGPWRSPSPASLEERLAAASERLGRESPARWGGFRPATPAELAAIERPVERGDVVVTAPRGIVLETRPRFRWTGGGAALLTVRDAAGATPLRAEVPALTTSAGGWSPPRDGPALAEGGEYVAVVEVQGPLGAEQGRAAFRVATAAERREAEEAERDARTFAGELAPLLYAQWALRRDLLDAAERSAGHARMRPATRALADAVLDAVGRRSGRP